MGCQKSKFHIQFDDFFFLHKSSALLPVGDVSKRYDKNFNFRLFVLFSDLKLGLHYCQLLFLKRFVVFFSVIVISSIFKTYQILSFSLFTRYIIATWMTDSSVWRGIRITIVTLIKNIYICTDCCYLCYQALVSEPRHWSYKWNSGKSIIRLCTRGLCSVNEAFMDIIVRIMSYWWSVLGRFRWGTKRSLIHLFTKRF